LTVLERCVLTVWLVFAVLAFLMADVDIGRPLWRLAGGFLLNAAVAVQIGRYVWGRAR
jgi:hypothetical protein